MDMLAEQIIPLVFEELGLASVKEEQFYVVQGILKRDVFVVLPTGFGKSACFQCLPGLYTRLYPSERSIVLVITPLTAIIQDQVRILFPVLQTKTYILLKQLFRCHHFPKRE